MESLNKEYLKHEIMSQSRHQYIYGYTGEERNKLIDEINSEYKIILDSSFPASIYISEFGLPKIELSSDNLDMSRLTIIGNEYLSFKIIHAILTKTTDCVELEELNKRITRIIYMLNKYSKNKDYDDLKNIEELLKALEDSIEFYKNYYIEYVTSGKTNRTPNDIAIPFIHLESFISQYKRTMSFNSYFALLLDKKEDISLHSTKAVNFLLGARINSDISIKVIVEPGKWDSFTDPNGQFIEYVHDYGIVELDESQKEYIKRLKQK